MTDTTQLPELIDWIGTLTQRLNTFAERSTGTAVPERAFQLAREVDALSERVSELARESYEVLHAPDDVMNEFIDKEVASDDPNLRDGVTQVLRSASGWIRLTDSWVVIGMHAGAVTDSVSTTDPSWLEELKARGKA